MTTSPGHVPRRGHNNAVNDTARAGPWHAGPCPGAGTGWPPAPAREMEGAGAKRLEDREGAEKAETEFCKTARISW